MFTQTVKLGRGRKNKTICASMYHLREMQLSPPAMYLGSVPCRRESFESKDRNNCY